MSRRKPKRPPTDEPAPTVEESSTTPSKLRPWLLAAATALLVARPLWPSESAAEQGDGAAVVMLWLVLLAGWLLAESFMGKFTLRWSALDLAVGLLIVLVVGSALRGASVGAPRLSINMLWEWVGFGTAYFLIRQLIASTREARAIVAVMIGLAMTLSAFGLYQYFVDMPATRAAYEANPDAALRQAGEWYPEGSRERQLFEQRLASTEPMATFALTNSLAGVLAPWLVALALVAVSLISVHDGGRLAWVGTVVSAGVIAFCLVLTKSRSAYLATAVGVAAVVVGLAWRWGRRTARILFGLGAAAALLVAIGVGVGGLDVEVLSEAPKSLGYRLQYWQSTRALIADAPLTGVGPGNFGDQYTRYKLPEASEEIADPHNFLLEVAATAGIPALLALGLVLLLFARSVWQGKHEQKTGANIDDGDEPLGESVGADTEPEREVIDATMHVAWGGVAGFLVAFMLGDLVSVQLSFEWMVGGCVITGLMVAALAGWIRRGRFTAGAAALCVCVFLINLLVAGGFTMPAVAGSFWLLLAVGETLAHGTRPAQTVPRGLGLSMFAGVATLAVVCHNTMYVPVVYAKARMDAALRDPRGPAIEWQNAANEDRRATEPRRLLCASLFDRIMKQPDDAFLNRRFAEASEELLQLRPHSSALAAQVAGWRLRVYGRNRDVDTLAAAIEAASRAVELYPTNARRHVQLAVALETAERHEPAQAEAAEALRLDDLTPHVDQKLSTEMREAALRLANGAN